MGVAGAALLLTGAAAAGSRTSTLQAPSNATASAAAASCAARCTAFRPLPAVVVRKTISNPNASCAAGPGAQVESKLRPGRRAQGTSGASMGVDKERTSPAGTGPYCLGSDHAG